jgi:hypothetical protein
MSLILQILFGCKHELGWPFSRKDKWPTHYQVCRNCGKEFIYTGPLK